MKYLRIVIAAILLLNLLGCASDQQNTSVQGFYYPPSELSEGHDHSGLILESREDLSNMDLRELVEAYLKGPNDPSLFSPIAEGITLHGCAASDGCLNIVFSDEFSELPAWQISISCAGLAMSVFLNTDITTVNIRCMDALLNGQEYLEFTSSDIAFMDSITTQITKETIPVEVTE